MYFACELWDAASANLLLFEHNRQKMVESLQLLFDENRLSSRLDNLTLMVYTSEDDTEYYEGVEAIEQWLTDNE